MYKALYRKYRPMGFDSVVGQQTIVRTLQNSIKNQSFSHAYMFFGPRGVGKTTASKIFARSVNCLDPIDGNACGKCKNCLYSFERECVDIIEIDAASNNGVDEIRELKNKISLVPAELKYKVYIIDEVHMLSIGAFNALLKTLEEPPEHAIFILATTDPQKVPETIISRCQCFSFKRISDEVIVDRLKFVCDNEKIDIDEHVLKEIAISSDGGMRDALGALDKLVSYTSKKITLDDFAELNGLITKGDLDLFVNYIFSGDLKNVLFNLNKYSSDGKNLIQIMLQIMHYLRNKVVNYYVDKINIDYNIDDALKLVNLINEKIVDIKKSGNPKIYIEVLLIKYIKQTFCLSINDNSKLYLHPDVKNSTDLSKNTESDNDSTNDKNCNGDNELDDEEFDFDKEYADFDDRADFYSDKNYNDNEYDDNSSINKELNKVPINISEIMKVRVNNTLATANKQILNNVVEKMKLLNDFTFDQKIGYIVCNLLDATVRAACDDSVILSYEFDSIVKQNLLNLEKMTYVFNKIMGFNMKLALITHNKWEDEKSKYIKSIKDDIHYKVVEEPKEIYEEIEKNDILSNSAVDLFGDIVEIN